MKSRTWRGAQRVQPECDSGALPAELQPRRNRSQSNRFPRAVKGAKARRKDGKQGARRCVPAPSASWGLSGATGHLVRQLAASLAERYVAGEISARRAQRLIREAAGR